LTGAPTAFAFALGFQADKKGTAANGIPADPAAAVMPIKTFLRVVSFSSMQQELTF
jgi:hypothetical protein